MIKLRLIPIIIIILFLLSTNAVADDSNLTPPLYVLWEHEFDDADYCSGVVTANSTYFVACDQIYAFDVYSGKILWKSNVSSNSDNIYYNDNLLYVGYINYSIDISMIYSLNASDGTLKWSQTVDGYFYDLLLS